MSYKLQQERFRSDYDEFRIRFTARFKDHINKSETELTCIESTNPTSHILACAEALNKVHADLNNGNHLDVNTKFKLLNFAKREEIFHYSPKECENGIKQLLQEAGKIDVAWRREAILLLLENFRNCTVTEDNLREARDTLYEARFIRDTYFDNSYLKMSLVRVSIRMLTWTMGALLTSLFLLSILLTFTSKTHLIGPYETVGLVMVFGLLGATFSMLLTLFNGNRLQNTIIKQLDFNYVTSIRLLIGACAGFVVYMFLNSGLVSISGISEPGKEIRPAVFLLVFAAGFTEKIVLNFLEKVTQEKTSAGAKS